MKKIFVYYSGWREHWLLGTLAHSGNQLLFEYSPEALRQGLELSPRHLPLREQAYGDFPRHLMQLPGLVADALPDGWGLMLMDRLFRQQGINPATVSPLDRLAFLGDRAMGALSFEPADAQAPTGETISLLAFAQQAQSVATGEGGEVLRRLALLGGSPHGARPKVLVHYALQPNTVGIAAFPDSSPWLVKFHAQGEHKEVCAVESLYAQLARNCGLDIPATALFDLAPRLAAFGIARFDLEGDARVPVHTLAGLLHADFRVPSSVDYTTFLRATRMLTRDEREVRKAYERAVFNVVFHNRDDHPKNFSFRLGRDRRWQLAPCYDLTFSEGPGGEHQMDICGEGLNVTRAVLLDLAGQAGVDAAFAVGSIDRIAAQGARFMELARQWPIRVATARRMHAAVEENRARLS